MHHYQHRILTTMDETGVGNDASITPHSELLHS